MGGGISEAGKIHEVWAQEIPTIVDISVVPSGTGVSARCEFEGFEVSSGYSMNLYLNQVREDGEEIEIALKGVFPPTDGYGVEMTGEEQVEPGVYKATIVLDRIDGGPVHVDNFSNSLLYDVVKSGDGYMVTPRQEQEKEPEPEVPEPGDMPETEGEPKPSETPETGSEPEPGDTPEAGEELEPGDTPEAGSELEPGDMPEVGSEPEPGDMPEAGGEPKPSETPETGSEIKPDDTPETGDETGPSDIPEIGDMSEILWEVQDTSCDHTPLVYYLAREADPDRDALLTGVCERCGEVLEYSFVPNSAYAAFLKSAIQEIQNTQTGEAVIETERWISFNQSVFDVMATRPEVVVTIRYRYEGKRYEVTIPAGAELNGLTDENGFCGFRYLDHVFGGREIVS